MADNFDMSDREQALSMASLGNVYRERLLANYIKDDRWRDFYHTKCRVKSATDILAKLDRKRLDNADYDIQRIDDVIGVRIVTLFKRHVVEAFEKVVSDISGFDSDLNLRSPFVIGKCKEVIAWYSSGATDEQSFIGELKAIADEAKIEVKPQQSPRDYSSIHIIAWLREVDGASPGWDDGGTPVEIQIRTVFEDAWAEIDHVLRYQALREVPADSQEETSEASGHFAYLHALKANVDASSRLAGIIYHKNLKGSPTSLSKKSDVIDMFDDEKAFGALAKDAPQDIINRLKALTNEVRKASPHGTDGALACSRFDDLSTEINQRSFDQKLKDRLLIRVRLEKAFCLIHSGQQGAQVEARSIYLDILESDPFNPIANYRIAQIRARGNALKAALDTIKTAVEAYRKQDIIDVHPIWRGIIYRQAGFYTWKLAEQVLEERIRDNTRMSTYNEFIEATDYTEEAISQFRELGSDEGEAEARRLRLELIRALNNRVYFLVRAVEEAGAEQRKHDQERLTKALQEFEEALNEERSDGSEISQSHVIKRMDTMMRALQLTGQGDRAEEKATRVKRLLEKKAAEKSGHDTGGEPSIGQIYAELQDWERRAYTAALQVLSRR